MPPRVPCCKPLRLIELAALIVCLSLLLFSCLYDPRKDTSIPFETLLYVYSAFGSIFLITSVDVICQMFGEPVTNTAMIIFSFLASVMCVAAGILLFRQYMCTSDNQDTYHFLFMLILLGSFSFATAAVYTVDGILVVKCLAVSIIDDHSRE